jgi:hypothetical protein
MLTHVGPHTPSEEVTNQESLPSMKVVEAHCTPRDVPPRVLPNLSFHDLNATVLAAHSPTNNQP